MQTTEIRHFKAKDQQAVRDLVLEGMAERWGAEFDPSYNKDLDDIHAYYIVRHRATVVVLLQEQEQQQQQHVPDDRQIIGCGILLPLPAEDVYGTWCAEPPSSSGPNETKSCCRMMRLSVAKDCRGQGHAKRIIRHLIDQAKERRFERILVETETAWTSAVGIYRSMGFRVIEAGEENVHYELDL